MTDDRVHALLAAYAHDPAGLTSDEQREVELLLAGDRGARGEAEADRALIGAIRDLPQPAPPAWDALARTIGAAIDEAAPLSRWTRLRGWLLRPAMGIGFAAATATVVGVWVARRPAAEETAVIAPPVIDAGVPRAPAPLFHDDPATAGELADLDQLDDAALDRLAASIGADPVGQLEEIDDDRAGLAPTPGAPLTGRGAVALDDLEADAAADALGDPDLDWVDELSDEDAAALDHWLAQHRSPT